MTFNKAMADEIYQGRNGQRKVQEPRSAAPERDQRAVAINAAEAPWSPANAAAFYATRRLAREAPGSF
jgi:hypothetical protein